MDGKNKLLTVKDLYADIISARGLYHAVRGVSFDIYEKEILGIVGESGCGKSTGGNLIVRLLKETEGRILFDGHDITAMNARQFKPLRKEMQMVFQDPFSSLNPRKKVFDIIAEPYHIQTKMSPAEIRKNVEYMMELVGLDKSYQNRYPHEFSGGQRQRIGIARALALRPKLVICDEPVSALDVSIQAQILNLLKDLQEELQLTYIFIAHGLPTVQYISDRIAVMYLGKIMEFADKEELFSHAAHPYSQALLSANPILSGRKARERIILKGDVPGAAHIPSGCRFHTRCPYATEECMKKEPALKDIGNGHLVACLKVYIFIKPWSIDS